MANGSSVISQAAWIYKLLQVYRNYNKLYLPLWILGYEIPLAYVRKALGEPLNKINSMIKTEGSTVGEIEDFLDDAAYDFTESLSSADTEILQLPQRCLEAFLNIFFNYGYDLNDAPFQMGIESLKEWRHQIHRLGVESKSSKMPGGTFSFNQPGGMDIFLMCAPFFKEYLSLQQLKQAVEESTDSDLEKVARDIESLREVTRSLHKMLMILLRDMPPEFRETELRMVPVVLEVGRLLVLADLSLRRNGFAERIDYFLGESLKRFQSEINERLEKRWPRIVRLSLRLGMIFFLFEA